MENIRLNKYIANTGLSSRRGADELIKSGKVKVNGKLVEEPGLLVSDKDLIEIENQKIKVKAKKYVIFNKPAGYITTMNDPQNRRTIYTLLPTEMHHLKPAGRLDKDSSGLLLLTNDGTLIQELTHPTKQIPKVYRVMVEGVISKKDIQTLENGIEIEKGKKAFANAVVIEQNATNTTLEITLFQGYNRQIRRMADYIKHPVLSLKRISHANLTVQGLHKGEYRYLSSQEVKEVYNYIKNM